MFASPTVVGHILYIGSCSGTCYALDKNTGDLIWKYEIGDLSFHGDPISKDSLLVIPTDGNPGSISAFSLSKGSLIWQYCFPTDDDRIVGVSTDLVLEGNYVYAVTTFDRLICLGVSDGTLAWEYRSSQLPNGRYWNVAPILLDSTILFIGFDGWLYCLDTGTGMELWKTEFGARPATSAVLLEDNIYIGCMDSTIYRLSCEDGSKTGSIKLRGRPGLQLSAGYSQISVFTQDDPDFSGMIHLYSLKDDLSEKVWERVTSVDDPWTIKKAYGEREWIVVGKSNGEVLFLDRHTGETRFSFNVNGEIRSLAFEDDMIYVGTIQGIVYAAHVQP